MRDFRDFFARQLLYLNSHWSKQKKILFAVFFQSKIIHNIHLVYVRKHFHKIIDFTFFGWLIQDLSDLQKYRKAIKFCGCLISRLEKKYIL